MSQTKPFRVLGIQQVAIGGPSKARLRSLWVDLLGLQVKSSFVSERENVDEDICALGSGPLAVEVDLMQPLDPVKKPAVHTTPLNHIGLWVDDLPRAVDWLGRQGVRFAPGGIRKGAAGHDTTSYSGKPTASVSSRNCMEAVGCVTWVARAAAVTLPVSARARNNLSCLKVAFIGRAASPRCFRFENPSSRSANGAWINPRLGPPLRAPAPTR